MDRHEVMEANMQLYLCGVILQAYFCFVSVRDIAYNVYLYATKDRDCFFILLLHHCFISIIDIIIMGILVVWSLTLKSDQLETASVGIKAFV